MQQLRVAQLSFWFSHANGFCREALVSPGVTLAAVWDTDRTRGEQKASEFGVPFLGDLDQLLRREDIDAVSLCAEPFRNPGLVEAACQAGKHVLIEKPMAADLDGAARIVRAVEGAGIQLMPAFNLRYHPVPMRIKELVEEGSLGRIWRVRRLHGHAMYERFGFDPAVITAKQSWGDPVAERRDSLFYAGSHVTLWFQWMFGVPETVIACRETVCQGLPTEDHSIAVLRYPSGMLGIMECSETLLVQGVVTEIYGTDGAVLQIRGDLPSTRILGPARTPLLVYRREGEAWEAPAMPPHFQRHEPPYSSVRQFFTALQQERRVPMDVYDGYDSIAMLVAAEQAHATRGEARVESWPRNLNGRQTA